MCEGRFWKESFKHFQHQDDLGIETNALNLATVYPTNLIFASNHFLVHTLLELLAGKLKGSSFLKISEQLTEFPREIFELSETLEYLDLSSNLLTSLPDDFGRLKKLKIFFASDNHFTIFPEVLSDCPNLDIVGFKSNLIAQIPAKSLNNNLRWLILTNNRISSLPPEIGNCQRLEKLMLAGNNLTALPEEMKHCKSIALLRIAANKLEEIPNWIYSLPSLAWLAFSGNPLKSFSPDKSLQFIEKTNITLGEVLGEGASGTIYKGQLQSQKKKDVAVKVFKGSVTSDGFPQDEIQAFIAAGSHPSLVPLIGEVGSGFDDTRAIVMELIPTSFYNLGRPPSLKSCTRDVFDDGFKLTVEQVISILRKMASVATHLHRKGISHGDLYAHNILIDDSANVMFSDFGAASLYDTSNQMQANLEKIEVKAYGHLLDDLINLAEDAQGLPKAIIDLRERCLSPNPESRPHFEQILERLGQTELI